MECYNCSHKFVLQGLNEDGSGLSTAFNAAAIRLLYALAGFLYIPIETASLVNRNPASINLDPIVNEKFNQIIDDNKTLVVLIAAAKPRKHAVNNKCGEKQEVAIASLSIPWLPIGKVSQSLNRLTCQVFKYPSG